MMTRSARLSISLTKSLAVLRSMFRFPRLRAPSWMTAPAARAASTAPSRNAASESLERSGELDLSIRSPGSVKREWAFELPDVERVREEHAAGPAMELEPGRLERE